MPFPPQGYGGWRSTVRTLTLHEFEQAYVAKEVQITINTTGSDLSLGPRTITVALPQGMEAVRAMAVALVHIANRTATAQVIDLELRVDALVAFSKDAVVAFPGEQGTAVFTIVQDCSTVVTGSGAYVLEAYAQISAAQNVTFTVEYLLFVQYRSVS